MFFDFQNPTKVCFGAGTLARLGELAKEFGTHAMIVTGGGSVRRSGVFDKAVASLKAAGIAVSECEGVEPNPRITSVRKGADIVRKNGCDLVIALGGGSVMDASKVIAAAALYDGDAWDLIAHGQENRVIPTKALPVITVPTLAATGSETNSGAVISNDETKVKSFTSAPCLFPKVAVVDPELTLSVPKDQTAYGVCDLITHVMESYFNGIDGTPIQDGFAETVIRTAIEWGPKAVANGNDIAARTQVQWAALVALNGWVQVGTQYKVPMHMIEHALSAHHNITHGAGLAIVGPAWMRFAARHRPERFAQYARTVFGIAADGKDAATLAEEGIAAYQAFLSSIGCPLHLSDVGITDESLFPRYATDAGLVAHDADGNLLSRPPMTVADIVGVLHAAL